MCELLAVRERLVENISVGEPMVCVPVFVVGVDIDACAPRPD